MDEKTLTINCMYYNMKRLRDVDKRSLEWIANYYQVNFRTVKKYLDMDPNEFHQFLTIKSERPHILDQYRDFVVNKLGLFNDTSAAQMHDWLKEHYLDFPEVHYKTVYNYVMKIRQEFGIPKVSITNRDYSPVPDMPPGSQAQVDFGQIKLRTSLGARKHIYFFIMLLCYSRHKFVLFRDKPFTAQSAIEAHERAFEYFEGMAKEIIYDQDAVFLSDENIGDLIMTDIFNRYQSGRPFKVVFCRPADPESKGKVENVVKYVKQNFLYNRVYVDEATINMQAISWLSRTGNAMIHNTTCKIPVEEWKIEKEHLLPWHPILQIEQLDSHKVIKTNSIRYKGNTYSLPIGTYKNENSRVNIKETDGKLIVQDENELIIAVHLIPSGKGHTIINNNHKRNMSVGMDALRKSVRDFFDNSNEIKIYIAELEKKYPRYIRDQLTTLLQCSEVYGRLKTEKALRFCLDNRLFSANDIRSVIKSISHTEIISKLEIKPIGDAQTYLIANMTPEKSDINEYEKLFPKKMTINEYTYIDN